MLPNMIRKDVLVDLFLDDHRTFVKESPDAELSLSTLENGYRQAGRIFEALIDSLPVEMIEAATMKYCGETHNLTVASLKRIVASRVEERHRKANTLNETE